MILFLKFDGNKAGLIGFISSFVGKKATEAEILTSSLEINGDQHSGFHVRSSQGLKQIQFNFMVSASLTTKIWDQESFSLERMWVNKSDFRYGIAKSE